jgi:hypothetical protein
VRAFGPAESQPAGPVSGEEALALARRFDLAARIGGRHALGRLGSEVGGRTAAAFVLEHDRARARATLLGELAWDVAAAAQGKRMPVALLKFAALRETGRVADGLRGAGDVDVLAPPEQAGALVAALEARGFASAGFPAEDHQLPQLRDGRGAVEVHVHVPGVRLAPDGLPATFGALLGAGLLEPVPSLPGECFVPAPAALVAHAVVHALAQHASAPDGYAALRLVGDLVALGAHEDPRLVDAAWPLAQGEVTRDEVDAAVALAARLARGDEALFSASSSESPEGVLLRHFVAGRLDAGYAARLRIAGAAGSSRGCRVAGLAREAWRALVLTDAQIDVIYGRPRSRAGYLARRLLRPLDLLRRAARHGWAAARGTQNRL